MFSKSGSTTALFVALHVLALSPAHASSYIYKIQQPCEGPFDKAITAAITSTKDLNRKILSHVETVPPGMTKYIEDEVRKAIQQQRADRFFDMTNNQFYYPVQIGNEVKSITDWLELALSNSGKSTAGEKLSASAMLQAISGYSDLMNDIYVYVSDDARRSKPYLSASDGSDMFASAQSGQEVLVKLLACMLVH